MKWLLFIVFFLAGSLVFAQPKLKSMWSKSEGFDVPESVCINPEHSNQIFVSNIIGKPSDKDGKGYVSLLTRDGSLVTKEFVSGLNAPKGMAVAQGKLYISDIENVVIADVKTGKVLKRLPIAGAKFLNDMSSDVDGSVYISDSETNKIWHIENDKASMWYTNAEFKKINGLLTMPGVLMVADMGTGTLYSVSHTKKELKKVAEGLEAADGIVQVGKDEFLVSSWSGKVFYVSDKGKTSEVLNTTDKKLNAADIEYIGGENILLVPTFFGNSIDSYEFIKK